jgi:hypothetical protein
VPVVARTHGWRGAIAGACVVAPMWMKRLLGNAPPKERSARTYVRRLLFDHDDIDEAVE